MSTIVWYFAWVYGECCLLWQRRAKWHYEEFLSSEEQLINYLLKRVFFQNLAKNSLYIIHGMAMTRTWGWWSSIEASTSTASSTVGASTTVITPAVKENSKISVQWACEQLQVWCDLPEAGSGQTIKESLCDNRGHSLKTDSGIWSGPGWPQQTVYPDLPVQRVHGENREGDQVSSG